MFASRSFRFTSLMACLVVAFSFVAVGDAEARKGGSFGSRGMNTFNSPAPTQTAPGPAAPIQRTMTPNQQQAAPSAQAAQPRGGFMNGFGGSLMRGLMLGGLFGLLLGGGFGGLGGIFAMLAQIAIIGGVIWLAMRFFRSRSPQPASAGGPDVGAYGRQSTAKPDFGGMFGGAGASAARPAARPANPNQLDIGMEDLQKFESMLTRVQAAFASENYAALRVLTTPEVMGYLSEELATNATNGVKNQVSDVALLQGDLSESWREGQVEYATVAMRYAAIDYMIDRATGSVVEGDAENPEESTEIWTFVRNRGDSDWRLSAIQEASN
ncbi:Predicted lipid-binding transport protein, Tim44 family [Devosia lucknowensis]|uniref:Predicted lipid-binding transport protein, Tim44 family n=1 Tax=Devosia lucknowensis TaxID=1096929 RepID=A0A1Y6E8Z3_9HYPH|nr:Tim44 domain-containing protein [Devosia lucknowensis]SMQ58999.1 Predicted lipid-binding transport protein, Tim44 family [Devosia lucknowensis]